MGSQHIHYTIDRVTQICGLDGRTIERIVLRGLIVPAYEDDQPVFSEDDLVELRRIRRMHQLGVNLAGVEVILQMRQRILELEAEVERLQAELSGQQTAQIAARQASRAVGQQVRPTQ